MLTNRQFLQMLLSLTILVGSALLTTSFVIAAPLHQEELEPLSTPDANVQVFLPLISATDSVEDTKLEAESQMETPAATRAATLCTLRGETPFYSRVDLITGSPSNYIYTAAPERGFRRYAELRVYGTPKVYFYGHSAERPSTNAWVWGGHLYNCR